MAVNPSKKFKEELIASHSKQIAVYDSMVIIAFGLRWNSTSKVLFFPRPTLCLEMGLPF
jgi:hypothetical protein